MSRLYITMYHYIRNLKYSRYPNIKGLDYQLFCRQIQFLKNNFNIVRMEQVIEAVEGDGHLPEKSLLLTFDDGYIDNYNVVFPLLDEYGIQGSFFVSGKTFTEHKLLDVNKIHYILASADISKVIIDLKQLMDYYRGKEFDYPPTEELYRIYAVNERFDGKDIIFVKRMLQTVLPEKLRTIIASSLLEKYVEVREEQLANELYMSEDQIRLMKRHGMYIGVHGYDHYWLGDLKPEQMKNDISTALDVLNEFIDRKCWVMNYPYGSYNQNVIEYIKSQGACAGLTTNVSVADISKDSSYELPRLDCNDFPPKSENYINY